MYARRDRRATAAARDGAGPMVGPERPLGSTAVLALQRSAGNRAVTRVLQRAPSGLKDSKPTAAFTGDALAYWGDAKNQAHGVGAYAMFLAGKANDALKVLGVPAMEIVFDEKAPAPGAFYGELWKMVVNTTLWSASRKTSKLSDLSTDEAANGAATIYHEARHAEQRFRVARMLAGQSKAKTVDAIADELVKALDLRKRDVAVAAAKAPLADTPANADLLSEARDWRAATSGIHEPYRKNVNDWFAETRVALARIRDLLRHPMDIGQAEGIFSGAIKGWSKNAERAPYFAAHRKRLEGMRSRSSVDSSVLASVKAVQDAMTKLAAGWATAARTWRGDGGSTRLQHVQDVKVLLEVLTMALQAAYRGEAHEKDAFETGDPVAAQFKQGLKPAAGAPAKAP